MHGGENKLIPNTNKKVVQTATGYNFKNNEEFVAKHKIPTVKNKTEESKFFGLSFRLPEESFEALLVAERKKTSASAITHKEIILTGNL